MTNSRMRIYLPGNQPPIHPGRLKQTAELRGQRGESRRGDEGRQQRGDRLKRQTRRQEKKSKELGSAVQRCIRRFSWRMGDGVWGSRVGGWEEGAGGRGGGSKQAELCFATSLTHAAVSTLAIVRNSQFAVRSSRSRCANLHLSCVSISF